MKIVYLLKDLSRSTGLSVYTIKYYLKIGLISEFGRSPCTNFRYFNDTTVNKLKLIRHYREQGKPLKQIQNIINKKNSGEE